jgi:hypothetical protein
MKIKFVLRMWRLPIILVSLTHLTGQCQSLPAGATGENWMGFLPDSASLFQMSLPGTHESMARFPEPLTDRGRAFFDYNVAPSIRNNIPDWLETAYKDAICAASFGSDCSESLRDLLVDAAFGIFKDLNLDSIVQFYATCQSDPLVTQLNKGVREIDVRFLHINNLFILYHGQVPMNDENNRHLEFSRDVLVPLTDWLESHPTETVVMRLRHEESDPALEGGSTRTINATFLSYTNVINSHTGKSFGHYLWHPPANSSSLLPPSLGAARGKFTVLADNWDGGADASLGDYLSCIDTGAMNQNSYDTADLENLWSEAAVQLLNANNFITNGIAQSFSKFALTPLNASRVQDILNSYYSAPYWMASGNGLRIVLDYPTSLSDAFDFLAGTDTVLSISTTGTDNGMNARTKRVISAECSVYRSGVVSMDFAPADLIQAIYSHNSFSTTAPVPTLTSLTDVVAQCTAVLPSAPTAVDGCGRLITGITTNSGPFGQGDFIIVWTFTDAAGNNSIQTQAVHVHDTIAPVIKGVAATPNTLNSANHKLVLVTVNYTATDNCGMGGTALSATSNEPDNGTGDGDTVNDIQLIPGDPHHLYLRAERAGKGHGRIYTITITATDIHNNRSRSTVLVTVPH